MVRTAAVNQSFGIGEYRAPGPLCGGSASANDASRPSRRDWGQLTLTMSATQPAVVVRHPKFYIDDRKPFVTLLVRRINLSHNLG